MKKTLIAIVALLIAIPIFAQKENKNIRRGNKLFEKSNYTDAEVKYRKALEQNPFSEKSSFNLGDALYMQKNYEEANKQYSALAQNSALDGTLRSASWHNAGNSFLEQKKYQEAIEAYKNALRINPKDDDTRYNLEYARQMLIKEEQEQKKDKKEDKKEEEKKDKKEDQQKPQPQDQKPNQEPGQKPQPKEISKQDAQRMLEAMKNAEQKTLENLQKKKGVAVPAGSVKDW
ncbi:MAG: tetratricopeptide repeat protein [Bacteroidales bacterium]|nr:tetratricopeptide repeat protein [Bacteroidales bacterium]